MLWTKRGEGTRGEGGGGQGLGEGVQGRSVCIAIPTIPRPSEFANGTSADTLIQLMSDLRAGRAGGGMFGRAGSLYAVLYSAACVDSDAALAQKAAQAHLFAGVRNVTASSAPRPVQGNSSASLSGAQREAAALAALRDAQRRAMFPPDNELLQRYDMAARHWNETERVGSRWMEDRGRERDRDKDGNKTNSGSDGSFPVQVLGPSAAVCSLMRNVSALEAIAPADMRTADKWGYWLWRTRVSIDYLSVLLQCLGTRPDYILLLEDDVEPAEAYDVAVGEFVDQLARENKSWGALALYYPSSYCWPQINHGAEYLFPCCTQVRRSSAGW